MGTVAIFHIFNVCMSNTVQRPKHYFGSVKVGCFTRKLGTVVSIFLSFGVLSGQNSMREARSSFLMNLQQVIGVTQIQFCQWLPM